MRRKKHQVMGHHAPAPRATPLAALLLAVVLSVPVFLVLSLLELLLH